MKGTLTVDTGSLSQLSIVPDTVPNKQPMSMNYLAKILTARCSVVWKTVLHKLWVGKSTKKIVVILGL